MTLMEFSESFCTKKCSATSHCNQPPQRHPKLYFGRGTLHSKCSKLNLWNMFFWKINQDKENYGEGRAALQSLVHDYKEAYHALSKEEQEDLLKEFLSRLRLLVSMLKVNDITQTLNTVENEVSRFIKIYILHSLKCCTGTKSILFTTCGSTDLPLWGITFTTKGVQNFIGPVMGIDNQDFMSKMEGFTIQGMKLASDTRTLICWLIYIELLVQHYQVVITGWPDSIKFTNLSNVSSALPDLKMLERHLVWGATKWVTIDDNELGRLYLEHDEQLNSGNIIDHHRHTRSDKGRKRKQPAVSQKKNTNRNKTHKNAEFIESNQSATAPLADMSGPSTTYSPY
ncbi:hypothetical protein P692DRAFT_20849639 [Suillus brevipes Sb2]|nr:hypothetical protein P692DRAFT_20849639 [Suillus brevipes Sb2]